MYFYKKINKIQTKAYQPNGYIFQRLYNYIIFKIDYTSKIIMIIKIIYKGSGGLMISVCLTTAGSWVRTPYGSQPLATSGLWVQTPHGSQP